MKFEKIKPGMTLYDVRPVTGIRVFQDGKWEWWPVLVKEVDAENRRIYASWNHNAPRWMRADKLRAKPPKEG